MTQSTVFVPPPPHPSLSRGTIESTALAIAKLEVPILDPRRPDPARLKEWAAPQPCPIPPGSSATSASVIREPKGTALVIGTWNFPIPLVFKPLVSALAAGCPTCVKLCEVNVESSRVMQTLLEKYCDRRWVRVVYGGIPQSTALLKAPTPRWARSLTLRAMRGEVRGHLLHGQHVGRQGLPTPPPLHPGPCPELTLALGAR